MIIRLIKIIFLVLFSFGVFTSGSAQKKFQEGFIIDLKGDTIRGHLLLQRSKPSSKSCHFKDESGKIKEYFPHEIIGYRFKESKYYLAKPLREVEDKKVFMEYLIKGKANIYYYRDVQGDHYFIEKEGGTLIELTEPQKVIVNPNGTGLYKAPPKYRGKLTSILNDAENIEDKISKTKLESSSLVALAKEYHDKVCTTEQCIIYERKKNKVLSEYSIVTGINLNSYNFGKKLKTNIGIGYQLGLMASFRNIFFDNENLGLITGLILESDSRYSLSKYDKQDIYNERVTYDGEEYIINNQGLFTVKSLAVKMDILAFKIPLILSHFINNKNGSLSIGGGLTSRFILSQNDNFRYNEFYTQYNKSINDYHMGFACLMGITRKINASNTIQINIMGEYLLDPRALNPFLRLRTSQLSLRVGYTF